MKRIISLLTIALHAGLFCSAQTIRYFEFRTQCGHGNWQDTSFIAATSNPDIIDSVLADIGRPYEQRKFISGPIAAGHGGHNHNASHWFTWHFIPNEWMLVEMAIEICDGCPFSDVEADTSYWLTTIGRFCPWSGKPVREITKPTEITSVSPDNYEVYIYPNPARNKVYIAGKFDNYVNVAIYNAIGQNLLIIPHLTRGREIDVYHLEKGIYFLKISGKNMSQMLKLLIDK